MPIYEFYCPDCNTIYNFWSAKVNTEKNPSCPRCDRQNLKRKMSSYAIISKSDKDSDDEMGDLPIDESKMEEAIMSLSSEAENINEDDPRAMARLMRKFSDKAGIKYNDQMEEALARLEAGEDPEQLEDEMGDLFDDEDMPFDIKSGKRISDKLKEKPRQDETLYDLDKY